MIRKLVLVLALLVVVPAAFAQTTTVTGTVTDPNSNPYANGTVSAKIVLNTGQALPAGVPASGSIGPFPMSGTGTFSVVVASPRIWIFTLCAMPVVLGPLGNPSPTQVCFSTGPIAISGGSQDISAQITAAPPAVIGPKLIGGGGGAVTSVFGRVGVVIAAGGDYAFSQLSGNIAVGQMNGGAGASPSTFFRGDGTWASAITAPCTSLAGAIQFNQAGALGCTSVALTLNTSGVCPNGLNACDMYQFPTNNICIGGSWAADANISAGNVAFFCNGGGVSGGSFLVVNSQARGTGITAIAVQGTQYPRGANNEGNGGRFGSGDDPLETLTGQRFYAVRAGISLTRASGGISNIEFFTAGLGEFGNSAYVNDIVGGAAAAETVGNAFGLHVLDLEGRGTTRTAAIQIDAQTNCGAAPCYAIKVDGGGVDFTNAPFFTPPTGWIQIDNAALISPNGLNLKDSTNSPAVGRINVQNAGTNVAMFDIANIDATPGVRVATITETSPVQNDVVCYNVSGVKVNCTLGIPIQSVTTTPVAIATLQRGNLFDLKNGAVNLTVAQAGSAGFGSNFQAILWNQSAAGSVTLTPATSTVNGNATLVVPVGWATGLYSDNTNYFAPMFPTFAAFPTCTDTGGNHLNISSTFVISCGTSSSGTTGIPSGPGAGSVNVMTATTTPAVDVTTAGTVVEIQPNLANTTTTPTLKVGAGAAQTMVKKGSGGALIALAVGDYGTTAQNDYFILISNGTNWILLNPLTSQFGNDMFIDATGDIQGNAASTGRLGNTNSLLNATIQTVTAPTAFKGVSYTSTTTSGNATFQGGIDGSLAGSVSGTGNFRGPDNTSTTANSGGGLVNVRGGKATGATANTGLLGGPVNINGGDVTLGTSTTDIAGAVNITGGACVSITSANTCNGIVAIKQPYFTTGTANANDLACVTAANTVASCSGAANVKTIGVIDSVSSNTVFIVSFGAGGVHTFNAASATFTNGDFVCQSSTAGAQVVDSATVCALGTGVGIYIGATGTQTAPQVLMRP